MTDCSWSKRLLASSCLLAAGYYLLRQDGRVRRETRELRTVLQLIDRNNTKRTLTSLYGAIRSTPRADDIFIATFPKVGTTVVQQITHQLRAGGEDWNFEEISEVAPWFESLIDFGRQADLYSDQLFSPRLFKSHLCYDVLPRGGKVITVLREPVKVLESYYHFYGGYKFDKDSLSMTGFAHMFWSNRGVMRVHGGTYYEHICSVWTHRKDPGLLILFYEDIVNDLESVVERVAAFMGIEDKDCIKQATRNSSRAAMLENKEKV